MESSSEDPDSQFPFPNTRAVPGSFPQKRENSGAEAI
jgi:hypothetical protein